MYIRKFNNKWLNDFNKIYLDNLNNLIEAFTIFYGNSYYKYIKGVITKLKFHFFINEEALVHVVDKDDNLMINKINSHVNTLKRLEKCDIKNGMTKTQVGFRCMKRFVSTKFGRKSLEYEMWRDLMFEPSLTKNNYTLFHFGSKPLTNTLYPRNPSSNRRNRPQKATSFKNSL